MKSCVSCKYAIAFVFLLTTAFPFNAATGIKNKLVTKTD